MISSDESASLEQEFGVTFPESYRVLLQRFPFDDESEGWELIYHEFDDLQQINQMYEDPPAFGKPFFIGSAHGEESFFIDTLVPEAPVYEYSIETGEHKLLYSTIQEFVNFIRTLDARHQENPVDLTWKISD